MTNVAGVLLPGLIPPSFLKEQVESREVSRIKSFQFEVDQAGTFLLSRPEEEAPGIDKALEKDVQTKNTDRQGLGVTN